MPMSDGVNQLRKIEFRVGDRSFRFAINPDNMVYARPHRTTAVKTKSRIIVEDFQSDIATVTISGTTGFRPTGNPSDSGIAKIKEMKKYLAEYADMGGNGETPMEEFFFLDYTNDEFYVVHLSADGVTYTQDVSQPLLHRYQIKFVILREASQPSEGSVVEPEIGNPIPSVGDGLREPTDGEDGDTVYPWEGEGSDPIQVNNPGSLNIPLIPGLTAPSSGGGIVNVASGPINPQHPSREAYIQGINGLGYSIGYFV